MSLPVCPECSSDELDLVEAISGGSARVLRCTECGHEWTRGEVPAAAPRTKPREDPPVVFEHDDAGYLEWTRKHSFGYVINTTRPPSAGYLMLHEATCFHITVEDHRMKGQPWTGNEYMKICSRSKHSLKEWARERLNGELTRCQTCAP